jgi:mRNA interferase ChpB
MERGDIYLVSLDPVFGHEQYGERPVLIISPAAFNSVTGTPVVLPITSGGNFARTRGFAVPLEGCGTRTTGIIRCDQLRSLDFKARNARYLEKVPYTIIEDVLEKLQTIVGTN